MKLKLTQPQLKALAHLELYPDEWRYDTPVAKNCLRKLWQKKLIEIWDEDDPAGGRYLRRAKILPAGQLALTNFRESYGYADSKEWKRYGNVEVRYNNKLGGWQIRVGGVFLEGEYPTETDAIVAGYRQSVCGLRGDTWIRHMALTHDMIAPYEPELIESDERGAVVSYGQSSYGYDIRVANVFKLYHNLRGGVIDPKRTRSDSYIDVEAEFIEIPANSFVLARSVEYMRIPRNVLVLLLGKSTYARCGLLLNFTPLEPDWEGYITIEISNTMPLPVKVYANEGIAQGLFFQSPDECEVSYGDRAGKYHRALDLELPKVSSRKERSNG